MTETFANGMPLPSMIESLRMRNVISNDHHPISILSLNLLAPLYVRPIDKRTGGVQPFAAFEWVKDDAILEWESRKIRLLECLTSCHAEVICVQELQLERHQEELEVPDWLTPMMEKSGYTVILPPKDELEKIAKRNVRVLGADAAVVCAIFVDTTVWKMVPSIFDHKNNNTCVSVCLQHTTRIDMDPLVVASVHLDASDEYKRISQLTKCLERARTVLNSTKQECKDDSTVLPLTAIIAGDMNAEFGIGSGMSAVLQDYDSDQLSESDVVRACAEALRLTGDETPSKQQLDKWKTLQTEAYQMVQDHCVSINRVDTGPTRCAYEHTTTTTSTTTTEERRMESWKLDHMLYTSDRLSPLARWATLEADSESCATGLPNAKCPSDHLPIACLFSIQPSSSGLDASKRQEVLDRLQELSNQHKQILDDTESAMEAKHQDVLKHLAAISSSGDGGTNPDDETEEICPRPKKRKKKKELPPKEIMEVTREKRALMKQLKKGHESEREQVAKQLGNLERLLIQEHYGVAWRQWVKNGS
jgi:mRNA deadenylase 3'-5' endonuclease subunit Ccr4